MKTRKRFIAGLMALAMLLLGTGYAYWTDLLQVDSAVSTGDLKVKFLDLSLYGLYGNTDNEVGWSLIDGVDTTNMGPQLGDYYFQTKDYNVIGDADAIANHENLKQGLTTATFNMEGTPVGDVSKKAIDAYGADAKVYDNINVTLTDIYPGYAQFFQADIVNLGNLAAKLNNINTTFTDDLNDETKNMVGVSLYLFREYAGENAEVTPEEDHVNVFDLYEEANPDHYFEVGGVHFVKLAYLEEAMKAALENNTLYINDNNRMDLYLGLAVDPDEEGNYTTGSGEKYVGDATNYDAAKDSLTQGKSVTIEFDFIWDQFNVGADKIYKDNKISEIEK